MKKDLNNHKQLILNILDGLNTLVEEKHGIKKNNKEFQKYKPWTFIETETELKTMLGDIELQKQEK